MSASKHAPNEGASLSTTEKPTTKIGLRLFIAALYIIFGVVSLEIGVRLISADLEMIWVPDPKLGWRNLVGATKHYTQEGDGHVVINEHGFRDRERQLERIVGQSRVAVFGDSMTQAIQVNLDQTYLYLLEDAFSQPSESIEFLNFGVSGYSLLQELITFKQEGPRYRPDLVLVAVFVDNDVSGSHPELSVSMVGSPFAKIVDEGLEVDYSIAKREYDRFMLEPIHTIRKYSHLYRYLSKIRSDFQSSGPISKSKSIPKRYMIYHDPLPAIWNDAWEITEAILLEFIKEGQQQNVPVVFISVPAGQIVHEQEWQNLLKKHPGMKGKKWDLRAPEMRLRAFANEHGISLIEPFDDIKKHAQTTEDRLFFGNVGHPTAKGHEILSASIEKSLREMNVQTLPSLKVD